MKGVLLLVCIACSIHLVPCEDEASNVESLNRNLKAMSRQLMLQQFYVEESARSEGHSGIKQIRASKHGTRPYHANSHTLNSVASIHDHANNIRTVGMGEFIAVLNGVEFRTRHNDYSLKMPHRTSKMYNAIEEIAFPDVPPEVTQKGADTNGQIEEMRAWFKAWKDQDDSVRDYKKYFKPVLCYLEGAWTSSTDSLEESFESDRHFLDASSWFDLQDKVRFTSYTGSKSRLENLAYLPTAIIDLINGTMPKIAQWNYRILCHPIKRDIPLNRLRAVDDLNVRMTYGKTYEELSKMRAARFQLNPADQDEWRDGVSRSGLLDDIMYEIPGKDNYAGEIFDNAFDEVAYELEPEGGGNVKLNAAYYHRFFKTLRKGAMGLSVNGRGFSDENLFMAMTTQPKIAGMPYSKCKGRGKSRTCSKIEQKWSYAIPLELIYLTPLSKWNPYNLQYKGEASSPEGKTVNADGRNGQNTPEKAYNGTNSKTYFLTPAEFYSGGVVGRDAADTSRNVVAMLDRSENIVKTKASGTHIFLPNIPDVGVMRQRYPIMPVYGEGSSVWKELEALKDIVLDMQSNWDILRQKPKLSEASGGDGQSAMGVVLQTTPAFDGHVHEIELNQWQVEYVKDGKTLVTTTETGDSNEETMHEHDVRIIFRINQYLLGKCDKMKWRKGCGDGHSDKLSIVDN